MSVLNPDEIATLLRARFTQREVNTQRIKFYNLFRIYPFLSDEVERQRKRDQMHNELVEALQAILEAKEATPVKTYQKLESIAEAALAKAQGWKE